MGLGVVGFLLLTQLSYQGSLWIVISSNIMLGFGQALTFTCMYIAASINVDSHRQGITSALVTTGQQVGSSIGLAVVVAVLTANIQRVVGRAALFSTVTGEDLNKLLHIAFLVMAVFAFIGVFVAIGINI